MDLYCSDKKLSELTDSPLDLLDSDMFAPPNSTNGMDHFGLGDPMDGIGGGSSGESWLDNFFQDSPVLNDRMISDALTSEHSYSLANNNPAGAQDGAIDGATGAAVDAAAAAAIGGMMSSMDQTLDLSKTAIKQQTADNDLDLELTAVNPNNMSLTTGQSTMTNSNPRQSSSTDTSFIKQEPLDLSLDAEMTTVTVTRSTNPQTLLKQPTIILATTTTSNTNQHHHGNTTQQILTTTTSTNNTAFKQERLVLPKVEIKMEPQQQQQLHNSHLHSPQQHHLQQAQASTSSTTTRYTHSLMNSPDHSSESFDNLSLPPTPPSSTNSDSDGGCDRSPPCSPHRSSSSSSRHHHHRPSSPIIQQPFFMSPIPTSGVLVLTEEEKRTLISEGYPIPGKLPLTKQEEKNLKKIRRKIKNKISAQESRRKKKEYLETLERKVEAYSQENVDLRKKVDNLQNNNQSLISQLHKLQAVVRNFRPLSPGGTQTGTCLMVLVLCFAVMLGSWAPSLDAMGYSSSASVSLPVATTGALNNAHRTPAGPGAGAQAWAQLNPPPSIHSPIKQGLGVAKQEPQVKDANTGKPNQAQQYGPYATPNMRSRVLLSVQEEEENEAEEFGPHAPFSYKWLLGGFFSGCSANKEPTIEPAVNKAQSHKPTLPKVDVMDVETEINQTGEMGSAGPMVASAAPSRHPDIAVTTSSKPINATA